MTNEYGKSPYTTRKSKKQFRKLSGSSAPVETAFYSGMGGLIRNYPPGDRRKAYLEGVSRQSEYPIEE